MIKKIDQTKYVDTDGWGNCVAACICTVLGIDMDVLSEDQQKRLSGSFYAINEVLEEKKLQFKRVLTIDEIPSDINLFFAVGHGGRYYTDGEYKGFPVDHMVVWSRDGLYHDPHKSRNGIEKPFYFEYVYKTEISNGVKNE